MAVIVYFLRGEDVVPTEKAEQGAIVFSKEQFNAGLRFPLPALLMEFLNFTQIPPVFIHPNIIRVLMGCSIINMLYNLDLNNVGGPEKKGHLVGWVEKASFDCLSKLFEIDAKEMQCKTLLTAREPDGGRPGAPRDLPIYEASKEADAEKRRVLLEDQEKKKNEGTLRKAPGQKRDADSPPKKTPAKRRKLVKKNGKDVKEPTPPKEFAPPPIIHEAEVMIEEPVNPAPHSISSGSGHLAGLNHSSTSLQRFARLANLAGGSCVCQPSGLP
ncbi:hypothetical protein CK203_032062 [Vitis vinifera]|uniref:Uncharacterized protein n=1 Tax=Vitis vinifera TaxID=29760 RepID=A0A438FN43_VITVI|nr:hypothetical protein CK203_032062 [Vitis vinifera]